MITLTPSGTPAETEQAHSLLAIIADPAGATKRLDELRVEKEAAIAAHEKATALNAETSDHAKQAAADLAEAKRVKAKNDLDHTTRSKQLSDHDAVLAKKQQQLAELEQRLTQREKEMERDLTQREAAVKAREANVTLRETDVRRTEAAAQALKEQWERRSAALREAMNPTASASIQHVMTAEAGSIGSTMGKAAQ